MPPEINSGMFKQIVCGIVIILVAGWITYVSVKGTSLDAMVAGINTRVTVLETVANTIKDDVSEMKLMIREIRNDQIKGYRHRDR